MPIQVELAGYSETPKTQYELYVACLYEEIEPEITIFNQLNVDKFNEKHSVTLTGFNQSLADYYV